MSIERLGVDRCVIPGGQAEIDAGAVVRVSSLSSPNLSWVGAHRSSHGGSFSALVNLHLGELVEYAGKKWVVEEYRVVNRLAPVEVYGWFSPSAPRLVLQTSAWGSYVHVWRAELAVTGAVPPVRETLAPLSDANVEEIKGPGVYKPITPVRVLDSRSGARPVAGSTVVVPADSIVPSGATAVLANITATDVATDGYITVWPTGREKPLASVLNPASGETRANAAIVPVGPDGRFALYTSSETHVIVDVTGFWVVEPGETARAGRFVPLNPVRITDTRSTALVAPGSTHLVPLPASVPGDAGAAVLVVTVTDASGDGYWTAYAPSTARPWVSTVNVTAGGTRANLAWVASKERAVAVYSQSGGHLVVDLVGYVTGPGAASSGEGRLVPVVPARVVDTRTEVAQPAADSDRVVGGRGRRGLPAVTALAGNLTIVDAPRAGFAVVRAEGEEVPLASNGNVEGGRQAVATAFTSRVGVSGAVVARASVPADLVVDVTGYFTG